MQNGDFEIVTKKLNKAYLFVSMPTVSVYKYIHSLTDTDEGTNEAKIGHFYFNKHTHGILAYYILLHQYKTINKSLTLGL